MFPPMTRGDDNGTVFYEWSPGNRGRLDRFLDWTRRRTSAGHTVVAAFDFDQTLIVNDLGDAVFYYMIEHQDFRFEDPGFLSAIDHRDYRRVVLESRNDRTGERFRDAFLSLYFSLLAEKGKEVAYPFATRIMSGWTPEEIRGMADRVIAREEAAPLGSEHIVLKNGGPVQMRRGIRLIAPMADLLRRLREAGAQVHVVTGTCQIVTERYVARRALAVDSVIGMRTEIRKGRLTDRIAPPSTVGEGKLDAVMQRFGRAPDLAAGDSGSDLALMRAATGEAICVETDGSSIREEAISRDWIVQRFEFKKGNSRQRE